MGNYSGPKVRLSRALGVPIAETPKHMRLRRENPPGMHPMRRGRRSLYGRQLSEKQKLARYYNLRDGQLRRCMTEASRSRRTTPVVLHEILESRLDNVIRRLGWARTIWQARQMVSHGHFQVNGQKVERPSYRLSPNDKITVKERSAKFVRESSESAEFHLNLDFEIDYNLIVEYYSR
jgi:small subunit ribosomal protein S4